MHWYSCKTFVCSYKVYLLCIGILVKHLFVVIKFTCYALALVFLVKHLFVVIKFTLHWYSCKTFVCSYKVYLLHWYSCKTFVCSYKVYLLCIGILVKHLFVVIKFTCYALVFL